MQVFGVVLFTAIVGGLLSLALLWVILYLAYKYKVFDPIGERHVHTVDVPRLGGLAFVPAILMSFGLAVVCAPLLGAGSAFEGVDARTTWLVVAALVLMYVQGAADDLKNLDYKLKFLCQFLSAGILVYAGVRVDDFMGLLGFDALPLWASIVFSFSVVVFIINALNLIDGIDGLSSGLIAVFSCLFGGLFIVSRDVVSLCLAVGAVGVVVPFYIFNVFGSSARRTKIFMGDCGSQSLGLLMAYFALRGWSYDTMPYNPLVYGFAILLVPSFDVVRVMAGRILRGNHPFHADKTHIHHKFLALGFSHRAARSAIIAMALCFYFLTIWLDRAVGVTWMVVVDVAVWCGLQSLLNFWLRQKGSTYFIEARKSNRKTT